jgi:chromosome segregation ATPase
MNALVKTIAPIVVVLASLGSLFFVSKVATTKKAQHAQIVTLQGDVARVKDKLGKTEVTLKDTQTQLFNAQNDTAQANAAMTEAKKETQTTKEALDQKTKALEETQGKLTAANKDLEEAKTAVAKSADELQKLQEKSAELAKLDEIKGKVAALTDENKELGRQLGSFREENRKLLAMNEELKTTPSSVRGQVSVVQDRWGFVVLNVGEEQKVRANAQFLVYRDSKLVCKVQVVSVGAKTSIAEMLPEYQRGYPRVGDLVVR